MATYSRPGVFIQEVALPQSVAPGNTSTAIAAFVGALPMGSTTAPVRVNSSQEFYNTFGAIQDAYPTTWAAYNFFSNGGRALYVQRVVGTGAATGSITITNGATGTITATVTAASASSGTVTYTASNTFAAGETVSITGLSTSAFNLSNVTIATATSSSFTVTNSATGTAVTGASATATVTLTPSNAFTLTANNPGSWANNYSVQVVAAGDPSRFGLNIYATTTTNGTTSSTLVETYTDLSMNSTDVNYVIPAINSAVGSHFTVGSVANSVFPGVMTAPVAVTGGVDGSTPTRAQYAAAWSNYDQIQSSLVLYAADAPYASTATLTAQMHGDALTYAGSRTDCFVVIDTPDQMTVTQAQSQVTSTLAIASAVTTGNIAASYYPWYQIPDITKTAGAQRSQAPGAGVVGQYLATDVNRGPAKTPAGFGNKMYNALSTNHLFTNAELDSINTATNPINPIRQVPGAGIVIMGGRTLDNSLNNRYINIRRSLIFIEKTMQDISQFAVFENNDSVLWSRLTTALTSFLFNYWQNGNLRGTNASQAFFVKCDSTTTSFTDIQNGRVNIQVGVALQYPAEFVIINVSQLTGNASA
jgi:phage tail sheath protein FI